MRVGNLIRAGRSGFSLAEILVGAVILGITLAAAASMALITLTQVETNARLARLMNVQEQVARLFQLGLSPSEAVALIPTQEPGLVSISPSTFTSVGITGVGTMEQWTMTMTVNPNLASGSPGETTWTGGSPGATRTFTVTASRGAIR